MKQITKTQPRRRASGLNQLCVNTSLSPSLTPSPTPHSRGDVHYIHQRLIPMLFSVLIGGIIGLWSSVSEARWPSIPLIAFQAVDETTSSSAAETQPTREDQANQETSRSPNTLQVLVISELMGYIEPCGCTIDLTLGAIERLSAQVKKLRSDLPTVVITAGSHLFEHEHVKAHTRAQEEAKAKLIRRVFSDIGVDAHLPGPLDLAAGIDFYRSMQDQHPLSEVTINHLELSPRGQPLIIDKEGVKVGIFGVVSPISSLKKDARSASHDSTAQLAELKALTTRTAQDLRARGAQVVIGLAASPRVTVRALAEQTPEVDLWVLGEKAQEESALSPVVLSAMSERAYIVEAGDRGRHLAQLTFSNVSESGDFTDPQGDRARALKKLRLKLKMKQKFSARMPNPLMKRQVSQLQAQIAQYENSSPPASGKRVEYQLIPITDKLAIDPEIDLQVKTYQASLQELNKAARQVKPPPANGNGYAGQAECALCHPDAQSFWEKTKHAHAWETLVKAKKTFDVECVSCHVTGWQEPGGSALGHTDKLQDVQCEACHGPAAKHAEIGGGESYVKLKVPSQRCETCHNQKHSPKFNYERYLKEIIGPGHGAPLPE